MNLSDVSIRRPVFAWMMSLALVLFGAISLARLPVRELPNIDPPVINVTTVYRGASAAVMETEVTERLEDELSTIEGIRVLSSESREQLSSITLEFALGRDLEAAAQDVRDRVARVRNLLPDDVEEPVVAKQEADAQPMLWYAMNSDRHDMVELTRIVEDQVRDRLQTVRGVSSIFVGGLKRYATRIRLDPARMAARGVTALDVERALARENVELPSGRIEGVDRELSVETRGQLDTPEEFDALVLRTQGGAPVRLRDVGRAEAGVEDEKTIARFKGRPTIGLGIVKQSTANTVQVARGVHEEIERIRPFLPEGIEFFCPYDESVYVAQSIREVWETLGVSFLLVIVTIFVFLRHVRSTLIPSLTIPVAVMASFIVFALLGFSVNTLTMLALVLAIGIVVDDSIIVLENIFRHVEDGEPPMQAAHAAMREITFAVIVTTVALAAVFLPLAFQTTFTGRLFIEFAVALTGAVAFSSFVALTLTPTVAARLVRREAEETRHGRVYRALERGFTALETRYARLLDAALRRRGRVLVATLAVAGLSALLYRALDREFLPEEDKGRLLCVGLAPEGATAEYTDRMVRKLEAIVDEVPEEDGYLSVVAAARGAPGRGNEAFMFLRLADERERSLQDVLAGPRGLGARLFLEVEGAFAIPIVPKAVTRGFGQPFQLVVQGRDLRALSGVADGLANELRAAGYLQNVRSRLEMSKPELRVRIDRERAAALGVSVADLSRTLQLLLGGATVSRTKRDGREYDVIVQLAREDRLTPDRLSGFYVRGAGGQLVELAGIVRLEEGSGPNEIAHYNRYRAAIIEATPAEGITLGEAVSRTEALVAKSLPEGYRYEWAAEARDFKEAGRGFVFIVLLALVVVYMVLAAQFESLVHPLTIMLTIPLAAVGAFGALWIFAGLARMGQGFYGWTHYGQGAPGLVRWLAGVLPRWAGMNVNLYSQIGLVLLVGMATKNAILLVDFAVRRRSAGASAVEAMREAGALRFRPILMTSFSTILGILPLAVGFGAGAETRRPMGMAAVGGMISSTFLTLVVIPVVYTYLDGLQTRWQRRRARGGARAGAATAGAALLLAGLLAGAPAPGVEPPGAPAEALDLPRCLALALEHSPRLRVADARVAAGEGARSAARAGAFPQLGLSAQFDWTERERIQAMGPQAMSEENWVAGLEARQPVYAGGRLRAEIRRAGAEVEAAVSDREAVRHRLVHDVRVLHAAALLAARDLEVERENVRLLEEQLAAARRRQEAGTVAPFHVVRAETALANGRTPLLRATSRARLALEQLRGAVGYPASWTGPDAPFAVVGELAMEPGDVDLARALADARGRRPDLARLAASLRAREAERAAVAAGRRPDLSVFGGYAALHDRFAGDLGERLDGWQAGARLGWTLWDGGLEAGRRRAADAAVAQARAQLAQAELDIEVDVRDAWSALQVAADLAGAARQAVRQADEGRRLAQARYDAEAGTQLELLDAQVELRRARQDELRALYQHRAERARLDWVTGRWPAELLPAAAADHP